MVTISLSVCLGRSVVLATPLATLFSCLPHLPSVIQVSTTRSEARGPSTGTMDSVKRRVADRTLAVPLVW